jgi:beta-lactamase class C
MAIAVMAALGNLAPVHAQADPVKQAVAHHLAVMVPKDNAGGVAAVLRIDGRTLFFNYGMADSAKKRLVTPDSIFNLASVGKVFAATLLAQAVEQGELRLDDPIAAYMPELQQGADIRRVTFGQLATHTSGLPRVPQDDEPWHRGKYTLPDFVRFLDAWRADPEHQPGQRHLYSNAGMVLLRLALQSRFKTPFVTLLHQRLTGRLGMSSTVLPLPAALVSRAVQGYGPQGMPIGEPGGQQRTVQWPGAGQIYCSPRDMAVFLTANLGELAGHRQLEQAMELAQRGVFTVNPRFTQALGWQVISTKTVTIVDKNGGMNNTSTYIGMIPGAKIGIVILSNRGRQPATRVGRAILLELVQDTSEPLAEGAEPD